MASCTTDPFKIYKYGDPEILRLTTKGSFYNNQPQDYQQLLAENSGSNFVDPEYPHTGRSVGNLSVLQDSANKGLPMGGADSVEWIRIKDWIQNQAEARTTFKGDPKWDGSETPVFNSGDFDSGLARQDIRQGLTGDCWFVASVSAVCADKSVLLRLVPTDNTYNEAGIYHFVFWYEGIWVDVPVDDYLPCKRYDDNLKPVGCSIPRTEAGQAEFWVPMLEKAYAKLMGSYQNIASNFGLFGLENLTGGFTEYVQLREGPLEDGLFEKIKGLCGKRSLLVLSCPRDAKGLVGPHAYSITHADTVYEYGSYPVNLIKMRNPHGHGEWKGDWSDPPTQAGYSYVGSRWNNVSEEVKQELGVKSKDDGEFFMAWDDLPKYFTRIDIVDLVREAEIKDPNAISTFTVYHGEWSKAEGTAGGINNLAACPQFNVTVETQDPSGLAVLFIGMMDKRPIKETIKDVYGAYVYKVGDESKDAPYDQDFFKSWENQQQKPVEGEAYERSFRTMTRAYMLQPGKYAIFAFSNTAGREGKFCLRVLAQTKGVLKTNAQ